MILLYYRWFRKVGSASIDLEGQRLPRKLEPHDPLNRVSRPTVL